MYTITRLLFLIETMSCRSKKERPLAKPDWIKVRLQTNESFNEIASRGKKRSTFTVCQEASCPNQHECWAAGTATFMILGDTCTRACKFCDVKTGNPKGAVDSAEPENIARSVEEMKLKYIVLTSVDRDDMQDQGAGHFAETVRLTKKYTPSILVETLTPDWCGSRELAKVLIDSGVDVAAHNIETVESLQRTVRDRRASYAQSLKVLELYRELGDVSGRQVLTKSSIMVGLGESDAEITQSFKDLRAVGCDVVTLGQYLQPSMKHLPVLEYVHPDKFKAWEQEALEMGFAYVASGPLVRSSYRAGEFYMKNILEKRRGGSTQAE